MNKTVAFLIFLLLLGFRYSESQNAYTLPENYFINPLELDLKLSGTFGELRSNHFHSGLDIKTQQRTGAKVIAAANGYVSRIKIERYGYGKALYITHPNGYTSVYAHLEKFAPRIEEYVKKRQYEKETFEIQLFPGDLELRVDQGELVAYSGNTGGSGGPHLHFEIRDNAARPWNPMLMGIDIEDTKAPIIKNAKAYPLDENATINGYNAPIPLRLIQQNDGTYKTESFKAYGNIGIGVSMADQQNGSYNQNGVYKITTTLNGTKNFEIEFDKYTFNESRHINQLIDYEHFKEHKNRITRLYVPNNSPLSLYKNTVNNGILRLEDPGTSHIYHIEVADFKGNTSSIIANIENESAPESLTVPDQSDLTYVNHNTSFSKTMGNFTLTIPSGALYADALLDLRQSSDTIVAHDDVIPLHKNIIISYDLNSKEGDNLDQYYIGRVTSWGAVYHVNTRRKGNQLIASNRYFGTFAVSKDIGNPTIEPVNFRDGQWISRNKTLQLKIDDKETGIDGYRATINGKYILMEYDYKSGLLTYDFDDKVVTDKEHQLKVIVTDNVGNSTTFEAVFYRKPLTN